MEHDQSDPFCMCPACMANVEAVDAEISSAVNPVHYANHAVAPIDLIKEYRLNFNLGNVIKYVARAEEKNGREDLIKAAWYLLDELGLPREEITALTSQLEARR